MCVHHPADQLTLWQPSNGAEAYRQEDENALLELGEQPQSQAMVLAAPAPPSPAPSVSGYEDISIDELSAVSSAVDAEVVNNLRAQLQVSEAREQASLVRERVLQPYIP